MASTRIALASVLSLAVFAPSLADAQVTVIEEEEAEVVERGYVQGQGRGIQYGAHLISPIYVMDMERGGGTREPLGTSGGGGVRGRIGWEFPSGLSVEVVGGIAFNYVPERPSEVADRSHVLTQGDILVGGRYAFYNETAFVPFIGLGGGLKLFYFSWPDGDVEDPAAAFTIEATVGAQIELSPFFGIELGANVAYTFGHEHFETGFISVTPFIGLTLYVYDEDE